MKYNKSYIVKGKLFAKRGFVHVIELVPRTHSKAKLRDRKAMDAKRVSVWHVKQAKVTGPRRKNRNTPSIQERYNAIIDSCLFIGKALNLCSQSGLKFAKSGLCSQSGLKFSKSGLCSQSGLKFTKVWYQGICRNMYRCEARFST